jgi:glycosyltransferase involved in cell wall biosynthesis
VIPNFVQLNNTGIFSTNDNKRVIFVGRIVEQKRIFDVLDIWQKVFQQYPDWQLDIFGDGSGEYREQVECIYRKQNANIVIHSPTNKIFDYYRKSDLLILTSEYEPFGLVIPEAMSCGLPVVSYRSPFGPESIITDGQDGFLVPLGNKDAFVDRLTFLMGNLSLRQEMGRRAVISSQRYSANIIMPKWKTLFERLVGTNSDT